MRRDKSLLGLGIVALVLVLGVGYAVVNTNNLTISGSANVKESKIDVEFINASNNSNTKVNASVDASDSLKATISVTDMESVGEVAKATYTIKNNDSTLSAKITEESLSVSLPNYFEVSTSLGDGLTITPNGSIDIDVMVELVAMPVEESETTIELELLATPVEP